MKSTPNARKKDIAMQNEGILYQVSLLQGLTYGDYNGSVTIRELKQNGNTGIGTFDRLNGELILLDGVVYRAMGDGCVEIALEDETTPFAVATYIDAYATRNRKELREIPDCAALESLLNTWVEENGRNCFHMIRIDGSFRSMNVRSVPAQKEPYQRLVDVLEKQQTFFDYENIEGTIVGLYCPPYMSSLNAVGWHMHFISSDKSKGGHVLGLHIADASLSAANIRSFHLRLPKSEEFNRFDLTLDQSKDIEKIEKNAN